MPGKRGMAGRRRRGGKGRRSIETPSTGNVPEKLPPTLARKKKRK